MGHGTPATGSIAAPYGAPALCMVLCGATGATSAPENTIGALWIGGKAGPCMVIGARVPGRKLGPERCCYTCSPNVEPRGGAGEHINNVVHCGRDQNIHCGGLLGSNNGLNWSQMN